MENRYLLISDLDGTLLGDDEALSEFAEWVSRRRDRLRLVYNSGRLIPSILDSVAETELPEPDAMIGGVGTDIRDYATGRSIGNWLNGQPGWFPSRIESVLADYEELELQPEEFLCDYKISYYLHDAPAELLDEMETRLTDVGCDVEFVYSSQRDLDVLPRGVNKGTASIHIASCWSYGDGNVFVSGDTGNDLSMFGNGFRGIVVGNAHAELKSLNGPSVYQATRTHAGGVLEGVIHWLSVDGRS